MAFTCRIGEQDKIIYVEADGPTDLAACHAIIAEVATEIRLMPDLGVLVDIRGIDYSPTVEDLGEIGATLGDMRETVMTRSVAIVSGESRLPLTRLACTLAEASGLRMASFSDYKRAKSWLAQHAQRRAAP